MKLRLFPQESAGLDILESMATEILAGTRTLAELLGAGRTDQEPLAEQMRRHEAASTAHFAALMTAMRTSFINPLPREDLFTLGRRLNEAGETLTGAGELIALHSLERIPARASDQLEILARQAELTVPAMAALDDLDSLEDYWLEILRLAKRAEHTHRVFVAELLDGSGAAGGPRYRLIADQLAQGSRDMRLVATAVGAVIVKES